MQIMQKLIISESVTFISGTDLLINIPEGSYADGCKYCIVCTDDS